MTKINTYVYAFLAACLILFSASVLTGCGKDSNNPGPAPLPPSAPLVEKAVKCAVYDIGAPISAIPNLDLLTPSAVIQSDSMNFLQVDEATPYAQFVGTAAESITHRFAMSCTTKFTTSVPGNHVFKLTSDDGSKLLVNGLTVINNDNLHGLTAKSTTLSLLKGVTYSIRVDYFENDGPKGLSLTVQQPAAPILTF